MVTKNFRAAADWTLGESFASAKTLKMKMPDLVLDVCTHCTTWCAVSEQYGQMHPLCYVPPKITKHTQHEGQGQLI